MENNFAQASHEVNARSDVRFFGKDLTNLDNQVCSSKDSLSYNRSNLAGPPRDAKPKCLGKPAPFQFYKGIFENQRQMHKRSATNEANKSGSIDLKEHFARQKLKTEAIETENESTKPEVVKLQLSKFLKSKTKLGDGLPRDEKTSQNQIEIRDFNNSQNCFDLKNPAMTRDMPPGSFTSKFSSISTMFATNKSTQNRPASISIGARQSPQGPLIPSVFPGPQVHPDQQEQPALKRIMALSKIQNLKLQTEGSEGSKFSYANIQMKRESLSPQRDCSPMQNELDLLGSQQNCRSRLFQGFDIPFMWSFLLSQEVSLPDSGKYVY